MPTTLEEMQNTIVFCEECREHNEELHREQRMRLAIQRMLGARREDAKRTRREHKRKYFAVAEPSFHRSLAMRMDRTKKRSWQAKGRGGDAAAPSVPPWRSGGVAKAARGENMTKKASPCAWRLTHTSIRDSSSDKDDCGREWRGDSQSGGAGSSGDVKAVSSKERGRCRTEGCVLRAHSDEAFDGYCCRRCPSGVHGKLCEGVLCDSMKSVAPVSPIKKVNRASREVGATTAVAGGAGKKSPVKEREGGAAFPKGWKEFWSEEFGIAYYWHDESEIAVWSRPDEAVAECQSEECGVYVRD